MPHEGYADPVTNDGPGFHSNMPISELTEHVTGAIEASDVSSAPLVEETMDRVMHGTRPTPYQAQWGSGRPTLAWEINRPCRTWVGQTWANTPNDSLRP